MNINLNHNVENESKKIDGYIFFIFIFVKCLFLFKFERSCILLTCAGVVLYKKICKNRYDFVDFNSSAIKTVFSDKLAL